MSELISVVVISKNEEEFIGKCIESVLEATKDFDNYEILLVDSASADGTIEIAKEYPIKIIQLKSSWLLSSTAGQYIGCYYSQGKYIQIVGGDMTLNKDWLKKALPILEKNEWIAGVVGIPSQEPYDNYLAKQFEKNFKSFDETTKEGGLELAEGAILFRKDVLEKSGSWNPYLVAEGERELSKRITNIGYKFYFLKVPSTHHLGLKDVKSTGLMKQVFRYATGQGQILRYSLRDKDLRKYWVSLSKSFFTISFLSIFGLVAIAVSFISGTLILIYGWLTTILLYLMVVSVKKHSFVKGILHFGDQLLKYPFALKGFLKTPRDPKTYPTDVVVLKE